MHFRLQESKRDPGTRAQASRSRRAVVIGGGVIGVTTAAALARRGMKVTLVERSRTLASGASGRNGAQLSYCYADALGTPAFVRNLPRLLAGLDPAVRLQASLRPTFWSWAVRFLRNCTGARHLANSRAVLRLALHSRLTLEALRLRYPQLEFGYAPTGKVHIYDEPRAFAAASAMVSLKNGLGCAQRVLNVQELLHVEPALAACTRRIVGAIYSPIDEAGDPYLFTHGLVAVTQREHDLTVLTGTAAERLLTRGQRVCAVQTNVGTIEADAFVLSAGSSTPTLARRVGLNLPIFPIKGYSVTLPVTKASPAVSVTDTRAKIVFCPLRGAMRIAGMADLGQTDTRADMRRIALLLSAARTCLPDAAQYDAEPLAWAGLRPMTPDSRPIIGRTILTNLFVNGGHGMLGWTLACASAELMVAIILDTNPSGSMLDMAREFRVERF
jgi:D-amino-acid dehydrogenase